ncbi:PREDICTED: protein aurora borealis [Polistes dominula]|uniref:Protein aurora borealis n=1 Tax=Polistes dominula TaxID=743375 RepID=A0ABM1HTZ9_POLDO|nr:PREDICTED: protein aurora borealis [Polistes dominula]
MYPKNTGYFTNLPNHCTPPSGLTKFVARNPFESDLTNTLHKSVISPSVFRKVTNPQHSPEFSWSVEELALIKPAKIEEFPIEQIHNADPDVELKAQEAIDKFFMTNEIVPSPWESKRKENKLDIKQNTPKRFIDKLNAFQNTPKPIKKDGACQTTLSFPSILPTNVEEALKPYFKFNENEEPNTDNDDANLSYNSLRRKLFFNFNECTDDEEQSSFLVSPIKMNLSSIFCKSPPESGMFHNGSPLKKCSRKMERYGTPIQCSENISPNISSIADIDETPIDDIKKYYSRPVMKLNFCRSMEMSLSNNTQVFEDKVPDNLTINEENSNKSNNDHENTKTDITAEMNSVGVNSTSLIKDNEKNEIIKDKEDKIIKDNNMKEIKNFPDFSQVYKLGKCTSQQIPRYWEMSEKQSASNIIQDTGYLTFSMNSTTNLTDNSSTKQKFYNNEQFLLFDDEIPLSDWKENCKNIACSTPSKYNVNEKG